MFGFVCLIYGVLSNFGSGSVCNLLLVCGIGSCFRVFGCVTWGLPLDAVWVVWAFGVFCSLFDYNLHATLGLRPAYFDLCA